MKTLLMAARLAIICSIGGVALLAPSQTVDAQEPTPTSITDLGLDVDAVSRLIGPRPRIAWHAEQGVDHFHLTATLRAERVNRVDPFCSPPARLESTTIAVDETLPGSESGFSVTFPPLADGDSWYVFNAQVRLEALDSAGQQLVAGGGGGVSETSCRSPRPAATIGPSLALPSTGAGPARHDQNPTTIAEVAAVLLLLGIPLTKIVR